MITNVAIVDVIIPTCMKIKAVNLAGVVSLSGSVTDMNRNINATNNIEMFCI